MMAELKIDEIEPGERVRVTFEGVLSSRDADRDVWFEDGALFSERMQRLVTQIERIDPPLSVGDRVRNVKVAGYDSRTGKVEHIVNLCGRDYCIVSGFGDGFGLAPLDNYGRVSD